MLLYDMMAGKPIPRAPSVPKIWLDLAATLLGRDYLDMFGNPEYAAQTVIEAANLCRCDGARVFVFPHRDVRRGEDGVYRHYHNGQVLGQIDIMGGWATLFDDPDQIDFSDPEIMINYRLYRSRRPILEAGDNSNLKRLTIPTAADFHRLYDNLERNAIRTAGEDLCLIGDCDSGTLAFCVAFLGMNDTLISLITEPDYINRMTEIGIRLCIEQAKFHIDNGVRVLRYNDSVANMSVISPKMWREFVAPRITQFCREVHEYNRDVKIYCHICGNVLPILDDLAATGLDCIAPLDPLGGMSITQVRERLGRDMPLMGGVNTLSFVNKTPEEICEEAMDCIREGFSGGHYAVGSGCVVPRMAKKENIAALRRASEMLAQMR